MEINDRLTTDVYALNKQSKQQKENPALRQGFPFA